MTPTPRDADDARREDLVLHRIAAFVEPLTLVETDPIDATGDATSLVDALRDLGWSSTRGGVGATAVLVAGARRGADLGTLVERHRPAVVAALETEPGKPSWPGWDSALVDLGYVPCQYTGTWRLYVAGDRAAELGPILARPVTAAELTAAGIQTRAELMDDLIRWRSAAVGQWAGSAESRHPRAADESAEVLRLRKALDATYATLSWRLTAPLRSVQRRRLQRATR